MRVAPKLPRPRLHAAQSKRRISPDSHDRGPGPTTHVPAPALFLPFAASPIHPSIPSDRRALRRFAQKSNRLRPQIQNNFHAKSPANPTLIKTRCAAVLKKTQHLASLTEGRAMQADSSNPAQRSLGPPRALAFAPSPRLPFSPSPIQFHPLGRAHQGAPSSQKLQNEPTAPLRKIARRKEPGTASVPESTKKYHFGTTKYRLGTGQEPLRNQKVPPFQRSAQPSELITTCKGGPCMPRIKGATNTTNTFLRACRENRAAVPPNKNTRSASRTSCARHAPRSS
jgi:hypothetical protein